MDRSASNDTFDVLLSSHEIQKFATRNRFSRIYAVSSVNARLICILDLCVRSYSSPGVACPRAKRRDSPTRRGIFKDLRFRMQETWDFAI